MVKIATIAFFLIPTGERLTYIYVLDTISSLSRYRILSRPLAEEFPHARDATKTVIHRISQYSHLFF